MIKQMKKVDLKIEKGISIPPRKGKGFVGILRRLQKDESVFLPITYWPGGLISRANLSGKATSRKYDGGFRVWRLK